MPSTKKQKAKVKSSRQLDVISDLENVNIMLGSDSRNETRNEQGESDVDSEPEFNRLQLNSNLVSEDFRSLHNTNRRESSEMTIETTRINNDEITNQVTRKLDEIRFGLNSQIREAINSQLLRR